MIGIRRLMGLVPSRNERNVPSKFFIETLYALRGNLTPSFHILAYYLFLVQQVLTNLVPLRSPFHKHSGFLCSLSHVVYGVATSPVEGIFCPPRVVEIKLHPQGRTGLYIDFIRRNNNSSHQMHCWMTNRKCRWLLDGRDHQPPQTRESNTIHHKAR